LSDVFEADVRVQDMPKEWCRRSFKPADGGSAQKVLQAYIFLLESLQDSVFFEIGVCQTCKCKVWLLKPLHTMNEDDSDHWFEFFHWFLCMFNENQFFPDVIVWPDQTTFILLSMCILSKRNSTMTVKAAVNLTEMAVSRSLFQSNYWTIFLRRVCYWYFLLTNATREKYTMHW
jgi:hypothetical protein